jgi:hypothetical protein
MKRYFHFFVLLMCFRLCLAQNVGIGTTTPNNLALLDISSTTKGVLFPRMTTLQRLGISSPPNGLVVYDTDKDQLYHYTGTTWLSVLNSSFWSRPITSRSRIANSTDSVGIGTVSPTEWLDVDGNIRSRNDLLADGRVVATGLITGGGLNTSGGLTIGSNGLIGGNFTANGELTTNSGININNAGGTLQLKNGSAVNKGFFQISGDNVRLGTNSGNATGDLIIRMNGADRITVRENGNMGIGNTGSPVYKLYVTGDTYNDGNINIDGKITKQSSSGSANLIPLCYGKVSANGTMLSGTNNVTVKWVSTGSGFFQEGYYTITCTGITNNSIIVVTDNSIYGGSPAPNYIFGITASYFNSGVARVYASWHILAAEEVYNTQTDFSFIITIVRLNYKKPGSLLSPPGMVKFELPDLN